ncbi:MAG: hypothetical protein Q8918_16895 [Bacteroidota bacterium]|nr:hypothetical protein [Bacteroidota bacterium]MDP4213192.1 hypothetical protein [Bacteroidota bacterium]MDP4251780.1 hypothetical protein [Bacteroidota bacterium]
MKVLFITLAVLLSLSGIAQPSVSGTTLPAADTIILLPTSSITLSGVVNQANPGHPVLDTTWTKTSGPAATITHPSNRMTTTVTGLSYGNYVFTLTATDKKSSASATVNVKVISGLLPVGLSNFHVAQNNNGILISWRTEMESNNSRFIIQKSTDGLVFADVASITSKADNGNSSVPLNYSYQISGKILNAGTSYMFWIITLLSVIMLVSRSKRIYKSLVMVVFCLFLFSCSKSVTKPDNRNTISAKTFYRLKLVNLDGQFNYSDIEMLN